MAKGHPNSTGPEVAHVAVPWKVPLRSFVSSRLRKECMDALRAQDFVAICANITENIQSSNAGKQIFYEEFATKKGLSHQPQFCSLFYQGRLLEESYKAYFPFIRLLYILFEMEVTRTCQFMLPYGSYSLFQHRDLNRSSLGCNPHLDGLLRPGFVGKDLDAKPNIFLHKPKKRVLSGQKRNILVNAESVSGASIKETTTRNMVPLRKRGEKNSTLTSSAKEKSSKAMEELDFERGVCIPFRKYTPEAVREKVLESRGAILSLISRGVEILWKLGLYWTTLSYDYLVGRGQEIVPLRAEQLRNLLCDLGPSFIKAGQVLANRPDIIREDYMNELCILQDDVPPFPNQVAFKIIEEELGAPLEQIFSKISAQTIAAASLGQVYHATLRGSGEEVAVKVQRPEIEPIIYRDLFLFRTLASFLNGISLKKLGCNAELIVDEFGEKLLEELDYTLEARNIVDFLENFKNDPTVKIPLVYKDLSGSRVLVMEWIDGIRCTNPQAIKEAGINVPDFLTVGVCAALRQLLEFGLFHGDPHPGNIFAMRDGRIAYVDFGNVAVLSQQNKQILIDAVVHAINEDYVEMANDFTRLGFLAPGTDVTPIVPALEAIWQNSVGKGLADFNFRSVTGKFNQLVYQYPIRIPERFSLVIRSLLTQEGICFTLQPDFKFLEVAYPYVAKRLLTDPDPALRERLIQVLFKDGVFQWKRLENLIVLAKEQVTIMSRNPALREKNIQNGRNRQVEGKLDLTDTLKDGARVVLIDAGIRRQLLLALTEDSKLHIRELIDIYRLIEGEFDAPSLAIDLVQGLPSVTRDMLLSWSESVLVDS